MMHKIADKLSAIRAIASRPISIGGGDGRRSVSLSYPTVLCFAVLTSLAASYVVCSIISVMLSEMIFTSQSDLARRIAERPQSVFAPSSLETMDIDMDPFAASSKAPQESDGKKNVYASEIDTFKLIGTVQPVAAWITKDAETSLVLKGQEYNGYVLTEVNAGNVVFTLGEERFCLYLYYSSSAQERVAPTSPPAAPAQTSGGRTDIQNAEFNGKDGVVTRELMHGLLMNPYEELGKLRLVPTQSGMIVQSMRPDSVLNQLGVRRGDEIKGVNGISIKDVPSIMNAISSMMNGTRLDFDITRNDQQGKLGYVVK